MQKFKVYDEKHPISIVRGGSAMRVPFCELKEGDHVTDCHSFVCESDAHRSDDADYDGWLVYSTTGEGYFPEDFGAECIS